jgi:hypothetical protein
MVFLVCGLALGCSVSLSMAQEAAEAPKAAEAAANTEQKEPRVSFQTEGDFFLGYRWVSTEDSLKAAEYIYPHSSASFGLNLLSCPLPYRYHVNAKFISPHDFYGDAGFAYKDLVLFRDILVGVHHNLDHFYYQYPGEPPDLTYTDRSQGEENYIDFVSNLMSLRFKAADFPAHAFINHRHVGREGRMQERFLLGYFNELNLISESRDIDWESNAVKLGANSHFGPIELEYAFDQADFDPGNNNILYDNYPAAVNLNRPADTYPHNVIAETESSAHSIRMHSSFTGSVVAAASVSNLDQKNNYSMAESSTWKGAFDFSWIPDPVISLFFKYRHRDVDRDSPDVVTLNGMNSAINYSVREGISYDEDIFTLASRYKPLQKLTLFADYQFSLLDRKDVDEWEMLTPQTKVHSIDLRAHARPFDNVKVKAIYVYKNYDQPAYNTTPDISNKLRLTTNYTPSPAINLYLEYSLFLSEREPLRYLNNDPAVLLETGERDGRRDQAVVSLTTKISSRASLTFSWFYQRWDVEQDLAYGKWLTDGIGDLPYYIDAGVPYTDKANSFSLALYWVPRDDITVGDDVNYTIAEGNTQYHDILSEADFLLSSYSNLESTETRFALDLAKKLPRNWEIGLSAYLNIFNDKTTGFLDGNVFTSTLVFKRYF